nr:probable NAD(P)H dehydrogenase (quinone) FQR1-like 1 [Tanacetum cinerariifolium]
MFQLKAPLEEHFGGCEKISRLSIPKDFEYGVPKGDGGRGRGRGRDSGGHGRGRRPTDLAWHNLLKAPLEGHFGGCEKISRLFTPKDFEYGVPKGNGFKKALELSGTEVGGGMAKVVAGLVVDVAEMVDVEEDVAEIVVVMVEAVDLTDLAWHNLLIHHGMIFVPIGYAFRAGMFEMEKVKGGSPLCNSSSNTSIMAKKTAKQAYTLRGRKV